MQLDDLLKQPTEWLKGTGPNAEIVLSSRIRLARNLAKYPFSHRAKKTSQEEVMKTVQEGLTQCASLDSQLTFFRIGELDELDRQFLLERHLISRELMSQPEFKAVAIRPDEVVSIMVNEEDHLRVQVMQSGFNLQEAWKLIDAIDDEMSAVLEFAYLPEWGYCTACPTNTGTGLRASVMLHLPALVITKQVNKVLQAIAKLSLTARGFYGEGTEASGNLFQISNQVTLGQAEDELIDNIERILKQIIEHEQTARDTLYNQDQMRLADRIGRAYGTLKSAHIISSNETLDLLSAVRLGVDMGLITNIDRQAINELFLMIQPAHLQKLEQRKLTVAERDAKRAALIRKHLGG